MVRAIQKKEEDGLILDHYQKLGGLVQGGEMVNRDKKSRAQLWFQNQIKSGEFVMEDDINELKNKTNEELQDIMRRSIDNSYVPSSIHNRAKQELEFRKTRTHDDKKKEIFKLSPEFHGVGVNLRLLWTKIKSWF